MSIELPKHYKETQISKPEAIGTGIANSAKTATNYIQADSTGIRIANANPATAATYQHQTATNTEFVVDGVSRAEISGDGARFGKEYVEGATDNESHLELDYNSMRMFDKEGMEFFTVEDLREQSGTATITDTFTGDGTNATFNISLLASDTNYSVNVSDSSGGTVTKYNDRVKFSTAPTDGSVITVTYPTTNQEAKAYTLGVRSNGNIGPLSFVEGSLNVASGKYAHAEGSGTKATGESSHAEGRNSQAEGPFSHSEGFESIANGWHSHAEGSGTKAIAFASHSQNVGTVAAASSQTVVGQYNIEKNGQDHIIDSFVGDGTTRTFTLSFVIGYLWGITVDGMSPYDYDYTGPSFHFSDDGKHLVFSRAPQNGTQIIVEYLWSSLPYPYPGFQYAFIIGNGHSNSARSNAATIDWMGNYISQAMAGIIQMFAGTTPPMGWLICDGSAISRETYATLFAAIGTTWGSGDGSTTFNIPDLRGRAPIGAGTGSGLTARTLGGKLGEETHSLTANESGLRAHTHSFTQPTVKVKYSKSVASGTAANHIDGSSSSEATAPIVVSGGAVGAVTGGELNGSAHNNMQPSAVVNFIICTGKTS